MRMVHSEDVYEKFDLSPKERKAYRERLRYWSKTKGLTMKEAHQKAIAPYSRSYERLEPTQAEVQDLVSDLKKKGLFTERSEIVGQADSVLPFPRPKSAVAKPDLRWLAAVLSFLPYALAVSAVSALLISASLEVWGYSWQGWLKACVVEGGILFLSLSPASSTEWWAKRFTSACLILLSFFVLHTGVSQETSSKERSSIVSDAQVTLLQARYDRLQASYDRLPENYLTKRAAAEKVLAEVGQRLSASLVNAQNSASVSAIGKAGMAENLLRACLLVLNLFFAHALIENLIRWRVAAST